MRETSFSVQKLFRMGKGKFYREIALLGANKSTASEILEHKRDLPRIVDDIVNEKSMKETGKVRA